MSEDINSFEYFEEMTTDWSRLDLLRRCYDLCNEMVEKQEEIERLNNIIKRYDKFIRRRLELEGYSDTFIKHQMRELKTPDHNDLLNTKE